MQSAYRYSPEPTVVGRLALTPAKMAAGLRTFFRIAEAWQLDAEQTRRLLGQPSRATLFNWKSADVSRLPHDTLCRISYVLGIWKALQILLPQPAQADAWLHKPNALLGGQSALQRMLAGDITDLAMVRALLDAARGDGA